jgi:iron complex outermembrane receptor protein
LSKRFGRRGALNAVGKSSIWQVKIKLGVKEQMTDLKFSKYLRSGYKAGLVASTVSGIIAVASMQAAAAAEPAAGAQAEEEVTELVVTGSRIVRRDMEASSPLMTVDAERFEQTSQMGVETVLNQMTQFTPGQGQFSTQGEIQTSPTASLGIGTANLRGISTNRTLVLVDGRRAQPANAALVVDLNTIPSAAISRVETITGGASSVYGADALAGVVNFVLKDKFQGIAMDLQSGITQEGDAAETRFSALVGMDAAGGRGNVMLGVEWYQRGLAFQRDRDWYVEGWNDPTNQISTFYPSMGGYAVDQNNRPSQAAINAQFPQLPPGTVTVAGTALTNGAIYFNKNGSAFVRTANGAPGFDYSQINREMNGDGYYGLLPQANGTIAQQAMDGTVSSPLKRRSAFGKANVEINDTLTAFVQSNFSRTDVHTYSAGPPPAVGANWAGSIPNDRRAGIPAGLQALLDSRPNPNANWQLNRGLDFVGNFGPSNSSDVYQIMAGLKGSFATNDWTWETYYSSGSTSAVNIYEGLPSVQRWQALVASPNFGKGQTINGASGNYRITCTSGLPIYYGDNSTTSDDCINGILGQYKSITKISQDIVEANLQGGLMNLPAGQLRFAAGASNRKNSFKYSPTNPQNSIYDFPLGIFVSNPTEGRTQVKEVYGELLVPVIKDVNLELGYRLSDYNSKAGTVATWKTLVDWKITDWARFRGGYQVANRAPNIAELYQSETTYFDQGFVGGDPCGVNTNNAWGNVAANPNRLQVQQLCAALIGNNTSSFGAPGSAEANSFLAGQPPNTGINYNSVGNPNLTAEKGKTITAGFVLQEPLGLDGLSASIDYYNIKVTEAIGTFSPIDIYRNCFNSNGTSNPGYTVNDAGGFCSLIVRAATGGAGIINTVYLNTGFINTAGVDLGVNYRKPMPFGGSAYFNNQVTYLDKYVTKVTPDAAPVQWRDTLGQGGQFKYRWNSTLGYNFETANSPSIGLRMRYLPKVNDTTYAQSRTTAVLPVSSYANFDLFGSINLFDKWQLRGGIDNVFYRNPAVVGATPTDSNSNSTNTGYYDVLGRRFYLGVHVEL